MRELRLKEEKGVEEDYGLDQAEMNYLEQEVKRITGEQYCRVSAVWLNHNVFCVDPQPNSYQDLNLDFPSFTTNCI